MARPVAMPYGLLGRPTSVPLPAVDYALDVDAANYIQRVEAVDGQALELPVKLALDAFVRGCKADSTWGAIKASCILAGARTLSGALVPLVGAGPTNFNFVTEDYSRQAGLAGNGSTKYLNTNRNANTDPQNNHHLVAYVQRLGASSQVVFGARNSGTDAGSKFAIFNTSASLDVASVPSADVRQASANLSVNNASLIGISRSSDANYTSRSASASTNQIQASAAPINRLIYVFSLNNGGTAALYSASRIGFYCIGEALDLALLDARVTTLMNTLAVVL